MKVTTRVIGSDVPDNAWSMKARKQLADQLPGTKVRNRVGSKLCVSKRGTDEDTDPIVGEVVSASVVAGEVIATLKLHDGISYGGVVGMSVGISASAFKEGEQVEGIERVDSLGLDDDPRSCSWGEVIG